MTLQIRMITDDDLDHVTDMWDQHVAEVGGAAFDPETRMRIFGGLCRCLPALTSVCYVAVLDSVTVGFIVGSISESVLWEGKAGDIEELYVKPKSRRKGVATQLVHTLSDWLRSKGAGVIRTQAVIDSPEARAFWESLGWEADMTTYSDYTKPDN